MSYPPLVRERTELRARLQENRRQIETILTELTNILAKDKGEVRRYSEYKSDFDKLNTDQVKNLFSSLDHSQAKQRLLSQALANAAALETRLGDPHALITQSD